MRALFFNEGNLGAHIMGQGQLEVALRSGLATAPDVDPHFMRLTAMGPFANLVATKRIGWLGRHHLDAQALRWHLVQSLRARVALPSVTHTDVIHVHTQSIALAMRGMMRRRPVALSVDTTVSDWWSMPAWKPEPGYAAALMAPVVALERRVFDAAAVVFGWTRWAADAVRRTAPNANVVECHPGIDLERHVPAQRRDRRRPRVLFVGGRFAKKGGEDLLAVLASKLGQEVELDVVTPASLPEIDGMRAHRLGPADPKLLDLQQQADVFCLPTYGDAAPWAVLEAMACGTPVLATDVGGISDLLDQGRAGVIVPHGDRRSLAAALDGLLSDPKRRDALALRARKRCEDHYDAARQGPRLIEYLRAAVEARSAARSDEGHTRPR